MVRRFFRQDRFAILLYDQPSMHMVRMKKGNGGKDGNDIPVIALPGRLVVSRDKGAIGSDVQAMADVCSLEH